MVVLNLNLCVHFALFIMKSKSLEQSPFQELERLLAMWFKQVTSSSEVISATLPREMALVSAQMLDLEYFKACNVCVVGFKQEHSVVCKIVSGEHKSWTSQQRRNGERNRYLKLQTSEYL
jgi:hypothetical protein